MPRADQTSKRPKTARRRGSRRTWLRRALRLAAIAGVAALVVLLVLYVEVTERFEGQLWKLPSRVYSDRFFLHPGDALSAQGLVRRLERGGYAAVGDGPTRPGEYRRAGNTLRVHLRGFSAPWGESDPRRVDVRFGGGTVVELRGPADRVLQRVELEPELLATLHGSRREERELVRLADVPRPFLDALLAAEDARFYDHHGIDPLAIVRAAFANARQGRIVQGGSTITQQLVKNLYLDQERTWWRKAREALLAAMLDFRYSKDRILEVYLNEVYLGQRGSVAICGFQAASRFYFGKDLRDLNAADSALLAGIVRNPGGVNPFAHREEARARRAQVLDAMVRLASLSPAEAQRAKEAPILLGSGAGGFVDAPYVADLVRSQISEQYSQTMIEEGGLRIYTTLDTMLQLNAETALSEGLARLERDIPAVRKQKKLRRLQGAMVVTEPRTGAILALVGGRDYQGSQFNRIVQARRQPGSCFKPFVYLAAFEAAAAGEGDGLTPASLLDDEPLELVSGGRVWRPENYDGTFRGPVTARQALEDSLNVPTIRAAQTVGYDAVVRAARRAGLPEEFKPLPSLALGAQEVTPLELATAYGTLSQLGREVAPGILRAVVGADGRPVSRREPRPEQVLSPAASYVVTDVLRGVLLRGTAASAWALGFQGDAAGKTGTTDDTRDAWFVGYTPDLLALVWVGYDDNFKTGLTGATGALPIWVDFMMRSRGRWGMTEFREPGGVVRMTIDPETGGLATGGCPKTMEEVFVEGTEPTEDCPEHGSSFRRWFRNLFQGRDRTH